MARTSVLGQIHTTLDDKDWILLRQLQKDARRSFAALGRDAGLSAPAAAERLRRLEQSGVIDGYHARVRPSEVGLDLRAFIEIVVKRTVSGRGSFLMKVAVPDVGGLEQLIGHLSQFGDTMTSLILSDVIERREFHP
jgi:Lrp/AsnC family leucine-responsive transcriptional regulator